MGFPSLTGPTLWEAASPLCDMEPATIKWVFGLIIGGMLAIGGRVIHNSLDVAVIQTDLGYIKSMVQDLHRQQFPAQGGK